MTMTKKKILVLGSTGMAGHVITTFFEETERYEVHNLAHRYPLNERSVLLDVTDFTEFDKYLDDLLPDVIINCIGVLNQFAENYQDKAILLNSYLPHFLQQKYRDIDTKVIHLSTDCVFSGKSGSYTETAFRDGDTFYDRTKALGEIYDNCNLTFRTSIIGPDINPDGIGLFHWFMNAHGAINGYANAIWTGITTIELAKAIDKAIATDLSGLYHLVPNRPINKYDLLLLFQKTFQRQAINIQRYESQYLDKSLVNTRTDFHYTIPTYQAMIAAMKDWIVRHPVLYRHYV